MLHHWGKDLQLLLLITLSLQLFRLLLIGVFHSQATSLSIADVLAVQGLGLRFDVSTAAFWVLPTFLASLSVAFVATGRWVGGLRHVVGLAYVMVAVVVFGADLVFFDEYGDQFNQHVFGLIHDDTRAILITVWKSYHPIPFLFGALALILLGMRGMRFWLTSTPAWIHSVTRTSTAGKFAVSVLVFLGFVALARGGTLTGEPIRLKHAFVAQDLFLNRTVVNPLASLHYAVSQNLEAQRSGGLKTLWPSGDVRQALEQVAGSGQAESLDDGLLVSATGGSNVPPKHVFLVLMESHSGWPLLPEYRAIGLSPRLVALGEQGLYFPRFLPSASGTIGSLNALVTGLPDAGLNINYEPGSLNPYPTSLPEQFRRLGYKTRFFYGGFLGWQRLDSFAQNQGFDEVHGAGHMRQGVATNEWGVEDKYLFDYVLDVVDDAEPSFNFILTTSNHPPYDLDLKARGFPVNALPESLSATKAETMKVLGHLWYTDQQAGAFVEKAEQSLTRPLFALTGDHTSRLQIRFPGDSVFEQVAVPFILYGPEVLKDVRAVPATAGSHIDIPATLIDLAAPAGFQYYTFGQSLLNKTSPSHGLGYQFIVGEGYVATDSESPARYALPGKLGQVAATEELRQAQLRFQAMKALSWYRVRQGSKLP